MNIKKIKVLVERYEDSTGAIHNTYRCAEIAQSIIDGIAKICPSCDGTKQYLNEDGRGYYTCDSCDTDGLVWKKEVWDGKC